MADRKDGKESERNKRRRSGGVNVKQKKKKEERCAGQRMNGEMFGFFQGAKLLISTEAENCQPCSPSRLACTSVTYRGAAFIPHASSQIVFLVKYGRGQGRKRSAIC